MKSAKISLADTLRWDPVDYKNLFLGAIRLFGIIILLLINVVLPSVTS